MDLQQLVKSSANLVLPDICSRSGARCNHESNPMKFVISPKKVELRSERQKNRVRVRDSSMVESYGNSNFISHMERAWLISQLPHHIEILVAAVTQINEPDSLYGIIQSHNTKFSSSLNISHGCNSQNLSRSFSSLSIMQVRRVQQYILFHYCEAPNFLSSRTGVGFEMGPVRRKERHL
ncbi:hypothetical protein OROMI_008777 [Orobanche minor]